MGENIMKKQIIETLEFHLNNLYEWHNEAEVLEDIKNTKAQIAYLEEEIRKEKRVEYVKQLKCFMRHMSDSFSDLMGDDCTNQTIDEFYDSDFELTFRGKKVTLCNGADMFQGIEELIRFEIDENEEV
jgi:hypothetical protein